MPAHVLAPFHAHSHACLHALTHALTRPPPRFPACICSYAVRPHASGRVVSVGTFFFLSHQQFMPARQYMLLHPFMHARPYARTHTRTPRVHAGIIGGTSHGCSPTLTRRRMGFGGYLRRLGKKASGFHVMYLGLCARMQLSLLSWNFKHK